MQTNRLQSTLIIAIALFSMTSCVSRKKYLEAQISIRYLKFDSLQTNSKINSLNTTLVNFQNQVSSQETQIKVLQQKNENLNAYALSTQKELMQSKKELNEAQEKLVELTNLLDQQSEDLKRKTIDTLNAYSTQDFIVTQKNRNVYVSLNNNLLFSAGSYVVTQKGMDVLVKLARILNANTNIYLKIENYKDFTSTNNYDDLSSLNMVRSASIIKILCKDYNVDPARILAPGNNEYSLPENNPTAESKSMYKKTQMMLSPKLDELYKLLEQ